MVGWKSPTIKHTGPEPAVKPCHLPGMHVQIKRKKGNVTRRRLNQKRQKQRQVKHARRSLEKRMIECRTNLMKIPSPLKYLYKKDLQQLFGERRGNQKITSDSIHQVKSWHQAEKGNQSLNNWRRSRLRIQGREESKLKMLLTLKNSSEEPIRTCKRKRMRKTKNIHRLPTKNKE